MAKLQKIITKKFQKGRIILFENKSIVLKKGNYGLKAIESGRITEQHLELLRRYLKRKIRYVRKRIKRNKIGKMWLLFQCKYPLTEKPAEIRMGKGKGAIYTKIYRIRKGKILLETLGFSKYIMFKIFKKLNNKLPVKTILIKKLKN